MTNQKKTQGKFFRFTPEFTMLLNALARNDHTSVTYIIEKAVRQYAKETLKDGQ